MFEELLLFWRFQCGNGVPNAILCTRRFLDYARQDLANTASEMGRDMQDVKIAHGAISVAGR